MKQKPLLIVAQAPGRPSSKLGRPLEYSSSLTRLATYGGVTPRDRIYELADVVNLIKYYPGQTPDGKYDIFPMGEAVINATAMRKNLHMYARVVLLGVAVRSAFARANVIPYELGWFEGHERWRGHRLTIITPSPHPAGTSTFWNDPAALAAGTAFWHRVFKETAA